MQELEALTATLQSKEDELNSKEQDLASLQANLNSKEQDLASLQANLQSKEQEVDTITEELNALRVDKEAHEAGRVQRGATASLPPEKVTDDAHLCGCTVYRRALEYQMCIDAVPVMKDCAIKSKMIIKAEQSDKKRLLGELGNAVPLREKLHEFLEAKHELKGRTPNDWFALHSQPGCRKQGLHYDYSPDVVFNLGLCGGCKPRSVLLALQEGTRLFMRQPFAKASVVVVLGPGDVIVFDGDVAHAGSWYKAENTRLHVYLDVPDVERKRNETWTWKPACETADV